MWIEKQYEVSCSSYPDWYWLENCSKALRVAQDLFECYTITQMKNEYGKSIDKWKCVINEEFENDKDFAFVNATVQNYLLMLEIKEMLQNK